MADLEHSARKLLRSTYTPINSTPPEARTRKKAWTKYSVVSNLQITPDELNGLIKQLEPSSPTILALMALVHHDVTASALDNVPLFAEVKWDALVSAAEALVKVRQQRLNEFNDTYKAILDAYTRAQPETTVESKLPLKQSEIQALRPESFKQSLPSLSGRVLIGSPASEPLLNTLFEWAAKNVIQTTPVSKIVNLLPQLFSDPTVATKSDLQAWAVAQLHMAENVVIAMKQQAQTEAVGLLHLERLNFVPAGLERGELIHSVPLSPGEEVNIAHKEWSNTSEEFSKIVVDQMEAYSEEGVTEKSELTQSATSQEQHSSGLNTGVTASGGYGPVTITAAFGYTVSDSASNSEQSSRNHSLTTTRKASSRSKQEHKISFKVASAAGTEDQEVRKIRNPFPDKATRVDYYQLVRKWRVDLLRYGLRLTYDITIPEPGSGLLKRLQQIEDLQAALEIGFGDPKAPKDSPASFPWQFEDITDETLISLAAQYGATGIDPYPGWSGDTKDFVVSAGYVAQEDSTHEQAYTQTITVPDGSVITKAEVTAMVCAFWKGDLNKNNEGGLTMVTPLNVLLFDPGPNPQSGSPSRQDKPTPFDLTPWVGRGGDLPITVIHSWVSLFTISVTVSYGGASGALQKWRMKTFAAVRDAAQSNYEQYRQALKDKLARLVEQLGAQDPLSLRKIEREEVMKGVIRWLFGPTFDFAPADVPESLFGSDTPYFLKNVVVQTYVGVWMSEVLAQGEIIKFLHHAIEWENMLYFLYPYFWSFPAQWEFKKYLNHPDLMHQVFLKSGSARVVLTIRPGFEKHFVSFLETGKFDALSADDPYWKIADEMEAYANTNYPGIKSANETEEVRPLLSPLQRKAWSEMQNLMLLLEKYSDDPNNNPDPVNTKVYPATAQGLNALVPYLPLKDSNGKTLMKELPKADPWKTPYVYRSPGLSNDYELVSYGADGAPGGEGDATDITSWAEANLIGRWYEYTPTSALDIAFDKTMPDEKPPTP